VYTFLGHLKLSALGNLDSLGRLVAAALGDVLNLVDNVVALENLAEDDVAAIEPACDDSGDEELAAIRVLSSLVVSICIAGSLEIPYPELAMLRRPLRVCLSLKFSSGNFWP
jgi:hypothetical protein